MGCLLQVGGSNECGSLEQKDKAVPGMARITQEKLGVPKPRRPAAEIPYLVAHLAYSDSENSSEYNLCFCTSVGSAETA